AASCGPKASQGKSSRGPRIGKKCACGVPRNGVASNFFQYADLAPPGESARWRSPFARKRDAGCKLLNLTARWKPGVPMIDASGLRQFFPREGEIPPEYRLAGPIRQASYLVNGELRTWQGAMQTVYSPVWIRDAAGTPQRVEIGSYPLIAEP